MNQKMGKWLRIRYQRVVNSIAFIPALSVLAFLGLALLMLFFDYSPSGKAFKSRISWLSLKDASTARYITATVAGGLVSLLVFSFSQVMILLNQGAGKMSNRILTGLIVNRFQQVVLGFYVGTIVYALFLLSTIRDIHQGVYVPALSIYLLMLFTIVDIFLFIYFLHFVTQSVRYEVIIDRLRLETIDALRKRYPLERPEAPHQLDDFVIIHSNTSGYLQGGGKDELLSWCERTDSVVEALPLRGSYVIKGTPVLKLQCPRPLTEAEVDELLYFLDFYKGQSVPRNPAYGFHQLKEIAITALKPGDPGTAALCIHALADLFAFHLCHFPQVNFRDEKNRVRISIQEPDFAQLLRDCLLPILDYARADRIVLDALAEMLSQLRQLARHDAEKAPIEDLLERVRNKREQLHRVAFKGAFSGTLPATL